MNEEKTEGLPSEHGYKTPWKPGQRNEEFWREVLVGRTVKDIVFDAKGMEYLLLDDGQKFFVNNPSHPAGCVFIKD